MRHGNMILAGQTLYIMEVEPAGYAALAANEAEKAANINLSPYSIHTALSMAGLAIFANC